ncbi:protein translocase subunit SecD [bacterium]|nr:protein translocase subunit SecD [bacterium]
MKPKHILILVFLLVVGCGYVVYKKPFKLGLDLAGGIRLVLKAQPTPDVPKITASHQRALINIIRRRVDALGVSEPLIQAKGTDQIVVELPAIEKEEQALEMLKSTAMVEFRYLQDVQTENNPTAPYKMEVRETPDGREEIVFYDIHGNEVPHSKVLENAPIILTGKDLNPKRRAVAQPGPAGWPEVVFSLNPEGQKKFAAFTAGHVGDIVAIVLDNKIISAPRVQEHIYTAEVKIEFKQGTLKEAQQLAELINAGALPVPLVIDSVQKVNPTLGQDSLEKSLRAGIIGLILVMLFMLGYYLLPGLIADIALLLYTLFMLAIFKGIPVTLTLPGIAALIITIGMAVDANILIFERLKEELRAGKTLRSAIDAGFHRAFTAIFDCNTTTVISAIVLYAIGTGPIKGFALTLGIGTILSMFTAITVSRTLLLVTENLFPFARNIKLYGVFTWTKGKYFHFVKHWKLWFAISLAIIIPGIIFYAPPIKGLKKGIDFTGGSLITLRFEKPVSLPDVRSLLSSKGYSDAYVQTSKDNRELYIRIKQTDPEAPKRIEELLAEKFGQMKVLSVDTVGPIISRELTSKAFWGVFLASILILLYLSFRFNELKYGAAAVIATLHDVLVMFGSFAILGKLAGMEIDSLFVTAVLTMVGFSVHDTIVVFDRIRENWRLRKRGESFGEIVDKSINQTLVRSINTSLTVLLVLLALFFFGGPTIKHFITALIIGTITGTYSSIFNASPIVYLWTSRTRKTQAEPVVPTATRVPEEREVSTPPASAVFVPTPKGLESGSGTIKKKKKRRRR